MKTELIVAIPKAFTRDCLELKCDLIRIIRVRRKNLHTMFKTDNWYCKNIYFSTGLLSRPWAFNK